MSIGSALLYFGLVWATLLVLFIAWFVWDTAAEARRRRPQPRVPLEDSQEWADHWGLL